MKYECFNCSNELKMVKDEPTMTETNTFYICDKCNEYYYLHRRFDIEGRMIENNFIKLIGKKTLERYGLGDKNGK